MDVRVPARRLSAFLRVREIAAGGIPDSDGSFKPARAVRNMLGAHASR